MTWHNVVEDFPQTNLPNLMQHFGCAISYTHEDVFEINFFTQPASLRVRDRTYTLNDGFKLYVTRDVQHSIYDMIPVPGTQRIEIKPIQRESVPEEIEPLPYAEEIAEELARAQSLHPDFPDRDMFYRQTVLAEEAGEVAREMLHYRDEGESLDVVRKELIQTASTAIRLLLSLQDAPEYYLDN